MGDSFHVDLSTEYIYQSYNAELVYDTTHFEDQLGVKITILEGSTPLTSNELTGIYIEHNDKKYFSSLYHKLYIINRKKSIRLVKKGIIARHIKLRLGERRKSFKKQQKSL